MQNWVGKRFGRLTILSVSKKKKGYRVLCRCKCGKTTNKNFINVISGGTKSCGCLWTETRHRHGGATRSNTWPEYWVWHGMRQRCSYGKHRNYKYYGGRGIQVCERWKNSFLNFISDMGRRPPGLTIERLDNA